MSLHKWLGIAVTAVLAGGLSAATAHAQDAYGAASTAAGGTYTATLKSPSGGTAGGMAMVKGNKATVKVTGDSAGAVRPWHVHKGSCGNDMGILGSPKAYKPIKIGKDGSGKGAATMTMELPDSGTYFVNIHASMADMKTIIACGDLTSGADTTSKGGGDTTSKPAPDTTK